MSEWIPDWAKWYTIEENENGSGLNIEFYNDKTTMPAGVTYRHISYLTLDLEIEDVKKQMRDKPLEKRFVATGAANTADFDMVNNPKHYQLMPGVEVYDVRSALLDKMDKVPAGQVDDWSRSWEYLTRMWQKNGLEDAKKCRWYLNKLIEKLGG